MKAMERRRTMAKELQVGDRVEWRFGRGRAIGTVQRKLTEPTTIGTQKVAASPDDPRYLVKTERSGKEAAKRAETLRRLRRRSPRTS
jgi:Hypervirulence associated proteins TUDOR domain